MAAESNTVKNRFTLVLTKHQIESFLLLSFLILWSGANTKNPDIKNYIYGYGNLTTISEGSYMYFILKILFHKLGASYEVFRLCLYTIGFWVIGIANKRMTGGKPFVYLFYAITLMMIDATQTYNFLGMSFLLLGVSYLVIGEKGNRVKYVISLIIASGFHIVFVFYIPFVFIYRNTDSKQLIKLYIAVSFVVFLMSIVINMTGLALLMQKFLNLVGLDFYQNYINVRTRYGHLYPMMTHIVCCAYSYFFYTKAKEHENKNVYISRIILLLNLYGVFAFPLFRFQLVLGRLTRNLTLLTCISGINYIRDRKKRNTTAWTVLALIVLAFFLGYFNIYSGYMDSIVRPFFKNNWIFGGF